MIFWSGHKRKKYLWWFIIRSSDINVWIIWIKLILVFIINVFDVCPSVFSAVLDFFQNLPIFLTTIYLNHIEVTWKNTCFTSTCNIILYKYVRHMLMARTANIMRTMALMVVVCIFCRETYAASDQIPTEGVIS